MNICHIGKVWFANSSQECESLCVYLIQAACLIILIISLSKTHLWEIHKGHLTFTLNYRWFPSYLLCTFFLLNLNLLPSTVHPTRFSFCFFPGCLAIFTLLSSNDNNHWQLAGNSEIRPKIPPHFVFLTHVLWTI